MSNIVAINKAREVRNRLWNPPNGHHSSDLDVLSDAELRRRQKEDQRQRAEAKLAEEDFKRRVAVDDLLRATLADHIKAKEIAAKIYVARAAPKLDDSEPPILDPSQHVPFIRDIVRAVADYYQISVVLVMSRRRLAKASRVRQIAYYLCHELTAKSMAEIGRRFNDRDHTTILYGWNKICFYLAHNDEQLAADIAAIKETLRTQ